MTANVPSLLRSWLQVKGQRGGRPSPINRRHWKRGEEAQRHCPLAWEGPASCCQLSVDRQDGTRTRLGAPCQRHALRYGTPAIPMERVARGQQRWLGSCRHKLYVAVFFCTHPMFLPVGRGDTAAYLCRAPNGVRHGLAQVPPHVLQRSDGCRSSHKHLSVKQLPTGCPVDEVVSPFPPLTPLSLRHRLGWFGSQPASPRAYAPANVGSSTQRNAPTPR